MRFVLSRSGAFRLFNITNNVSAAARSQSAVTTTVLTRPRHYTSGPDGHIRDATDSAFSKKEKAIEDQWIRMQDAEKIKKLREELANQKEKLKELEDKLSSMPKKD
jgi:hypothetical protein